MTLLVWYQMRFFHGTAMAGRLHLLDIGDYGLWQPERIRYEDEEFLDAISARMTFQRAKTVQDLDAALESSRGKPGNLGPSGSITVWIIEDLLDAAKERWEEMRNGLLPAR